MKLVSVFSALIISGMFQYIAYAEELLSQQVDQQQSSQVTTKMFSGENDNEEKDTEGDIHILPKEKLSFSIKPRLLTGVMYFKHMTLDKAVMSNKPVPMGGLGLNINIGNWFLNGYGLDTAKATDHSFEPTKLGGFTEANYKFGRQDYAVTLGREITDWLSTDSKDWGISLFVGYRYGKTTLNSVAVTFNEKNDGKSAADALTETQGKYIVKGPMAGISLRKKLFKDNNSQIGLTIGYGPLHGEYTRPIYYALDQKFAEKSEIPQNETVNTWVTALSWEGELTPNLSYSIVFDYYSYSMQIPQGTDGQPFTLKEAVGGTKIFLNYRFDL